jgi:hypothetical protein
MNAYGGTRRTKSFLSMRLCHMCAGGPGGGNLARFPSVPNALPSADLDQLLQQHHEGVRALWHSAS